MIKCNWSEKGTHDSDVLGCMENHWEYQDLGNDCGNERLNFGGK